MSGQDTHTYNNLTRRDFVKKSLLTLGALSFIPYSFNSCKKLPIISGGFIEDNAKIGHLLREGIITKPAQTINIQLLIVGAGISGLTAAYHLHKNNYSKFLLLDLASVPGGNAISSKNSISSYPWAAHYLPIVNLENKALIDFLYEHNIIVGFDSNDLPIYNEYYLCFDPEDRLFIKGNWQDGLVPNFGVPKDEQKEITRFFDLVKDYKFKLGNDGKPVFEIPLEFSSTDEAYRALDKISFAEFLTQHKFTSPHLLWYLNYCCKDDYGSTLEDTSAYAGMHYFCARRAKASNAESSAVLTWPEGNSFLAEKLYKQVAKQTALNQLITSVSINGDKVDVISFNSVTSTTILYKCDQLILATPQYINHRILSPELKQLRKNVDAFEYTPWMVANITLKDLPEYKGEPLSWDNVFYNSKSLGYVNACHQKLSRELNGLVLTYYYPFCEAITKQARKQLREKTYDELKNIIIDDLKQAHKDVDLFITHIDIKLWGHGMVKPKPDFVFNKERLLLKNNIKEKIFFAHTDLSGLSIFEEAFYQGTKVANEILAKHV